MSKKNELLENVKNTLDTHNLKIRVIGKSIGNLSSKIRTNKNDIVEIKKTIARLELNEEVTTEQAKNIVLLARSRVSAILSYDEMEHAKYFRSFIARLYKDAKKSGGLGSTISETKKGNYQRCLDFIEAWNPDGGSAKLKAQVDKRAKARVEAKRNGYAA